MTLTHFSTPLHIFKPSFLFLILFKKFFFFFIVVICLRDLKQFQMLMAHFHHDLVRSVDHPPRGGCCCSSNILSGSHLQVEGPHCALIVYACKCLTCCHVVCLIVIQPSLILNLLCSALYFVKCTTCEATPLTTASKSC